MDLQRWLGVLGLGVAVFVLSYHYNKRFLEWMRFQSLGTRDYIVERLSVMFIDIPPHHILLGQFILSFGAGIFVFAISLPHWGAGMLLGGVTTVIGWKLPKPIVDVVYQLRVRKFVLQMIDGLALMSNGMKSGLSISQSLGLVVREMPDPIRQEFNLVLSQNQLGVPLEECFSNLSKRIESEDVQMFVTSVNILKETGGNLAETFDTISQTIRERVKVEKKIDALTTQGKIQGYVVLGVPPVLGLILYQSDPGYMTPLFTNPIGWLFLSGVLILEFVLFVFIKQITKIEV